MVRNKLREQIIESLQGKTSDSRTDYEQDLAKNENKSSIKQNYENIIEWQMGDNYYGDETYHSKCNTCGDIYASIWSKGYLMFVEKIPYKINIFYSPKKKMRCFIH